MRTSWSIIFCGPQLMRNAGEPGDASRSPASFYSPDASRGAKGPAGVPPAAGGVSTAPAGMALSAEQIKNTPPAV